MKLQLSRASDLAVRALLVLDRHDGRLKASAVAEQIGTSGGLLHQVLHPLIERGWIDSLRGPQGGYALSISLDDLDVLAVIEAVEGVTDTGRCVLAGQACRESQPCALHEPWQRARRVLLAELAATPVSAVPLPDRRPHRLTGPHRPTTA